MGFEVIAKDGSFELSSGLLSPGTHEYESVGPAPPWEYTVYAVNRSPGGKLAWEETANHVVGGTEWGGPEEVVWQAYEPASEGFTKWFYKYTAVERPAPPPPTLPMHEECTAEKEIKGVAGEFATQEAVALTYKWGPPFERNHKSSCELPW
jgi:hypothetical protein